MLVRPGAVNGEQQKSGQLPTIPIAVVSQIGQMFVSVFVLTLTVMDIRLSSASGNISGSALTFSEPPWAIFLFVHFRSICVTYHLVWYLAIYLDKRSLDVDVSVCCCLLLQLLE
mgnify:CR=1 FL=1